jgi:hypothetical protein
MSTLPDNEFDLEKLFLPAWAQQDPSASKYAKYEGEEARPERRGDRRGPRPPRREGPPGPRREGREGYRPREDRRRPVGTEGGAPPPAGDRGPRRGPRRFEPRERREPPAPLPEVDVTLVPEEKGVESLARQIKMTGRAYPLFDIAQMILQKPERHTAVFHIKKNAEGKPIQPLFVCALDDTLWLSEDEAIGHVLRKHFSTFYQAEKTATEPPKGKYTFVAQCGLSGNILGPPNYHDYQNQLRKLHAERFSRMAFEVYKSRVRIVRDEEVVKKWVEDQSWKTQYLCLNLPEPLRLENMEAVDKHFRDTHKENIIKPVETQTLSGTAARNLRSADLARLARNVWEDQRRFPLQIATVLSQQFASHGLQFFKVNKTITHVSVARPHYLDLDLTPVSEGVKAIVDFINAHPKCTRRLLVETLAPAPAAPTVLPSPAPPETQPPAPAAESATPSGDGQPAPGAEAPPVPAPAEKAGPTPEQNAVIGDLHWLIHQGHVIEFANGTLETAKKPLPKPPKPEPKPAEKPAEASPQTEAAQEEASQAEPAAQVTAVPAAVVEALTTGGNAAEDSAKPADSLSPEPQAQTARPQAAVVQPDVPEDHVAAATNHPGNGAPANTALPASENHEPPATVTPS